MTDAEKTETTRGLDTTAVLLLSALVGATLIYFGRPFNCEVQQTG